MPDDLVARLRALGDPLADEAADRIRVLEQALQTLRSYARPSRCSSRRPANGA